MRFAAHLLLFPSHYLISFSRHFGNRTVNGEQFWNKVVSFKSTLQLKDCCVHYWVNNVCLNWVKRNVNFVIHPRWIFCYIARGPLEPWGPWTLSTLVNRLWRHWLCLSVRPFVCHKPALYIKTAKRRITQTTPYHRSGTLVFWCQKSRRNANGVTPCDTACVARWRNGYSVGLATNYRSWVKILLRAKAV